MKYNWQLSDWADFRYETAAFQPDLYRYAEATFIAWFNKTAPGKPQAITPGPVRAAVVHLYFESIHPFEDGNGRVGRALAQKALSQDLGRPALISLSQLIDQKKKRYYEALEQAQTCNRAMRSRLGSATLLGQA